MNKIIYILTILILLTGCAKEEAVPVIVDFEFEVFNDDFSIPVQVVFFNRTEGGDDYEWTFEGGVPSRSVNRNPGMIQYDTKGTYTIELFSTNQDGEKDSKTIEIQIDDPVLVDFEVTNLVDNFAPATYALHNKSSGADSYIWTFEGGTPATSSSQNPGEVVFTEPGDHTITLEISNGRETYDIQKTITVAPFLISDFGFEVAFDDDDYQVPARIQLQNNSTSATSYHWDFSGASIFVSDQENPEVVFTHPGTQTVLLTATNGKETKTSSKEITFFTNTNLRTLKDIKLGVNSAHHANTIGSFYSIDTRKVYMASEMTSEIEAQIDLVFFGLSNAFTLNRFVNPAQLGGTTFEEFQNPRTTRFINSQELCGCATSLTSAQFDAMQDDALFRPMVIEETPGGLQSFDDTMQPRIVLFQTQEGTKGAIKIKDFVDDGANSYILVDIKVQKEAL
ncbi:PKD domain-containing protein [Aquimarina sediminis]|uniref:PKD domain-containing protein n=1 Tax=Aquimarina sediminis TaxID=2070536 RepID=UPI000CA08704|nr:PKD domain-containing protein [Aquimarina sediminis]